MSRRKLASALTLGVAAATVTSAMAIGGSSPQVTTVVQQRVDVRKVDAPKPAAKAFAPMMKVAVPLGPANLDAQVQNYLRQFRPILRAEYHIVRAVCRPTSDQRKAIARDAEKNVRQAARDYAGALRRPMNIAQRAALDPRRQIREALAASVKEHCSSEAADRYREELARRDVARKHLAARNLVARLDQQLILSHDQREKIEASLFDHWEDSWCSSLQMFMNNSPYIPPVPDPYVAPFLNDPQKTIWHATRKVNAYWGSFDMMGGVMMNDPIEDEELRAARLQAEKDDPMPAPNQRGGPVLIHDANVLVPAPRGPARPAVEVFRKRAAPAAEKAAPKR